jgi:hypothetical protein
MAEDHADRLIAWGFVAGYVSVMGSLLLLNMPAMEGAAGHVDLYFMLPLFAAGAISTAAGCVFHPRQRWGTGPLS